MYTVTRLDYLEKQFYKHTKCAIHLHYPLISKICYTRNVEILRSAIIMKYEWKKNSLELGWNDCTKGIEGLRSGELINYVSCKVGRIVNFVRLDSNKLSIFLYVYIHKYIYNVYIEIYSDLWWVMSIDDAA